MMFACSLLYLSTLWIPGRDIAEKLYHLHWAVSFPKQSYSFDPERLQDIPLMLLFLQSGS